MPFPEAFSAYRKWLHGALEKHLGPGHDASRVCFVTVGDWDLKTMLPAQLRHVGTRSVPSMFRQWCNIKTEFGRFYRTKARSMADMLKQLRMKLQGRHHSGIDDCRNTARILVRMMNEGARITQTWKTRYS